MKLLIGLLFSVLALTAQTNPACPNATGAQPHCVTMTWTAPVGGAAPTSYNIYTSGTTSGGCAVVTSGSCTKIGSVSGNPPVTGFTHNTTPTFQYVEGLTYFFVVTAANSFGESGPSMEASATVPFVFMPTTATALACTGH